MRTIAAMLTALLLQSLATLAPTQAGAAPALSTAASRSSPTGDTATILNWMMRYAEKPDPAHVASYYVTLGGNGALLDPEQAGVYLGFLAGVINAEGPRADKLLKQLTALTEDNQWIVVRALAWSGHPDWRGLMQRLKKYLPARAALADSYLNDSLPRLGDIALEIKKPNMWESVKVFFGPKDKQRQPPTFLNSPELLDVLWGLYFATGSDAPISGLLMVLPWSHQDESVDKLTIGSLAKFTLAENASRSTRLLKTLKAMAPKQPRKVAPVLAEVIKAADTVDTVYLRRAALAQIEDAKQKGSGSMRKMAWWGQAGEYALSAGCLAAAVSGAGAAIGIPCVVGGAVSSAALKAVSTPQ